MASYEQAARKRDEGISLSADNAGDWVHYAVRFIEQLLRNNPTLHVDEVWDAGLEPPPQGSGRALGQAMRSCSKRNLMSYQEVDGGVIAKQSVRSNLQLKPIWKSNIYFGDTI